MKKASGKKSRNFFYFFFAGIRLPCGVPCGYLSDPSAAVNICSITRRLIWGGPENRTAALIKYRSFCAEQAATEGFRTVGWLVGWSSCTCERFWSHYLLLFGRRASSDGFITDLTAISCTALENRIEYWIGRCRSNICFLLTIYNRSVFVFVFRVIVC